MSTPSPALSDAALYEGVDDPQVALWQPPSANPSKLSTSAPPIIVIGNGPVGMRFAEQCLARLSDVPVIVYGEEPYQPYNRIKLSSWLAGDVLLRDLTQPMKRPFGTHYEERFGYQVTQINPVGQTVTDSTGRVTAYSKLILATGSRPYVPNVPGIQATGVYTLRNMKDAQHLLARRVRSHHTVVIGGGLLGLEAARGMQPLNTRITVVEHADRLMAQQLDVAASAELEEQVAALGIATILGDGIKAVNASPRVTGVVLQSGRTIECDTVIVATGIVPNIDLAKASKLAFGRGVQVNDQLQTSDEHIYAIGECAEHMGETYGLVAPGFEQSSIALDHIAGLTPAYTGSPAVSRLKVVGASVFSMGPMGQTANPSDGRKHVFRDQKNGIYRAIRVRHNKLVGAVGVGPWDDTLEIQSAITEARRVYPWQIWRFKRTGQLLPAASGEAVSHWPADRIVCQCMGVNRACLSQAISDGANSLESLRAATRANTVCGSCEPQLLDLLGNGQTVSAPAFAKTLLVLSGLALLAMLIVALFPGLPYADTVQLPAVAGIALPVHWDVLWRDGFYKQVSGFSVLGVSVIAAVLSFRKRIKFFHTAGRFDIWRLVHVVSGVVGIALLMLHTGFRLGHGLNQLLMVCFMGLIVLGSLSSVLVSVEPRSGSSAAATLRKNAIWLHILLFLPVPVLLAWHILKGYWY